MQPKPIHHFGPDDTVPAALVEAARRGEVVVVRSLNRPNPGLVAHAVAQLLDADIRRRQTSEEVA